MSLRRVHKKDIKPQEYESKFDLNRLFQFSKNINSTSDLKIVLSQFLFTIMGKILSPRAVIALTTNGRTYRIKEVKGLSMELIGQDVAITKLPQQLIYLNDAGIRRLSWVKVFREHKIDFLVPLLMQEKVMGIAGYALMNSQSRLSEMEETYINSLANITAVALEKNLMIEELKQVNRRLDGKVQELNTLFDMSKEFNAVLDSQRLVKLLIFSILGQIGVNRYFICLKKDGAMQLSQSRLDRSLNPELFSFFSSVQAPTKVELLRLHHKRMLEECGIELLVPLQLSGEIQGMIGLGEKIRGEQYTLTDIEFLSSLANLAIVSLENARLFQEAIEKQKLEDDLMIAREIQRGLLPAVLPSIPRFEIAGTTISSKQVGGDYYDVIQLDDDKFVIAIGDVSGKGTPASLLMANLQATIRALAPLGFPLTELTKRVNDLICDSTSSGRFVTFFWGILNTTTKTLQYVNAGHNPPFLFRTNGNVERLDRGGIILGVLKNTAPYQEGEVIMHKGELLLMFTDGVSEAVNNVSNEFGEQRLESLVNAHRKDSVNVMLSRIVEAVDEHSKNLPQTDDITLVVLKSIK